MTAYQGFFNLMKRMKAPSPNTVLETKVSSSPDPLIDANKILETTISKLVKALFEMLPSNARAHG